MHQYPRQSPVIASPANSARTNSTRTNNQREGDTATTRTASDRRASTDQGTIGGENADVMLRPSGTSSSSQSSETMAKLNQILRVRPILFPYSSIIADCFVIELLYKGCLDHPSCPSVTSRSLYQRHEDSKGQSMGTQNPISIFTHWVLPNGLLTLFH